MEQNKHCAGNNNDCLDLTREYSRQEAYGIFHVFLFSLSPNGHRDNGKTPNILKTILCCHEEEESVLISRKKRLNGDQQYSHQYLKNILLKHDMYAHLDDSDINLIICVSHPPLFSLL